MCLKMSAFDYFSQFVVHRHQWTNPVPEFNSEDNIFGVGRDGGTPLILFIGQQILSPLTTHQVPPCLFFSPHLFFVDFLFYYIIHNLFFSNISRVSVIVEKNTSSIYFREIKKKKTKYTHKAEKFKRNIYNFKKKIFKPGLLKLFYLIYLL